jgi:hypothetical protein
MESKVLLSLMDDVLQLPPNLHVRLVSEKEGWEAHWDEMSLKIKDAQALKRIFALIQAADEDYQPTLEVIESALRSLLSDTRCKTIRGMVTEFRRLERSDAALCKVHEERLQLQNEIAHLRTQLGDANVVIESQATNFGFNDRTIKQLREQIAELSAELTEHKEAAGVFVATLARKLTNSIPNNLQIDSEWVLKHLDNYLNLFQVDTLGTMANRLLDTEVTVRKASKRIDTLIAERDKARSLVRNTISDEAIKVTPKPLSAGIARPGAIFEVGPAEISRECVWPFAEPRKTRSVFELKRSGGKWVQIPHEVFEILPAFGAPGWDGKPLWETRRVEVPIF